jgi:hypothetical protein
MKMTLAKYIKYWDNWHKEWSDNYPFENIEKILGWHIPKNNMGNDEESFQYFPEPYLLKAKKINAVFLNINPGKGGPKQQHSAEDSLLIKLYEKNDSNYSETISAYLSEAGFIEKKYKRGKSKGDIKKDNKGDIIKHPNDTANWFKSMRVNWAKDLMASDKLSALINEIDKYNSKNPKERLRLTDNTKIREKIESKPDTELINELNNYCKHEPEILCADLIPWHSNKASDINFYVDQNELKILVRVVLPLIYMANEIDNAKLKNKIFVRGVTFRNIINNIFKNKPKYKINEINHYVVFKENDVIDEFNSLLTTFTSEITEKSGVKIKTKWYVFTGGQSMLLPDLSNKNIVQGFENPVDRKNLRTFLLESNP